MFSPRVQARGVFLFVLLLSLETVMRLCLLSLIFTGQRIKKGKGELTQPETEGNRELESFTRSALLPRAH